MGGKKGFCGLTCLKNTLDIFNLVFVLAGIGIIGVVVWTLFDRYEYVQLLSAPTYPILVNFLLACGILILGVSFLGCFATYKENGLLLILYIVVLLLIFLMEVMVGILGYIYEENIQAELGLNLNQTFLTSYGIDERKTLAIDALQQKFQQALSKIDSSPYNKSFDEEFKYDVVPKNKNPTPHELKRWNAYLDSEWNFTNTKAVDKSLLPHQIENIFYQNVVKENKNRPTAVLATQKILFNKKPCDFILQFDMNSYFGNATIEDAELHFYLHVKNDSDLFKNSTVLRLYQIEKFNLEDVGRIIEVPDEHKLLNVVYLERGYSGWQMFKIRKTESWLQHAGLNFMITMSLANHDKPYSVFNDSNLNHLRTFLMLRLKDEDEHVEPYKTSNHTTHSSGNHPSCNKREFYVDFKKLHWNNFIIAPEGYMANDCFGKCTKYSKNTSNHIKILNTFQNVDQRPRSACCAPRSYSPLVIMFYNKIGDVVIKPYGEMIVNQCGCI